MYDAKKLEKDMERKDKKYKTIGDRGYFFNQSQSHFGKTKLSYVPKENLFE